MSQPENQTQNKTKSKLYEEENEALIQKEKSIFAKSLREISVKIESKKSVQNFLEAALEEDDPKMPEINEKKNKCLIWFNMKIIGIIFMTLYIIGLYIFIGFMNSVMEEIKASATLYLSNTTRNENERFNDNYNQINQEPQEFELYFLTSNLSGKLLDCLTIYGLTIIDLIINAAIFFGIYNFEFHILPENINTNYNIWQFLYLVLMYILLYLSIGLISSLPHSIFTSAFDQYEKWKEERQNNQLHQNAQDNQEKPAKKYNGYWLGYFISILFSMGLKYILNQFIIVQKHGIIKKFYGFLIACHWVPILLSLVVYYGFSKIFNEKIVKQKAKKNHQVADFLDIFIIQKKSQMKKKLNVEDVGKDSGNVITIAYVMFVLVLTVVNV